MKYFNLTRKKYRINVKHFNRICKKGILTLDNVKDKYSIKIEISKTEILNMYNFPLYF